MRPELTLRQRTGLIKADGIYLHLPLLPGNGGSVVLARPTVPSPVRPSSHRGPSIEDARRGLCTPQIRRYMSKISRPPMDRTGIQVDMPAVPYKVLAGGRCAESSE